MGYKRRQSKRSPEELKEGKKINLMIRGITYTNKSTRTNSIRWKYSDNGKGIGWGNENGSHKETK